MSVVASLPLARRAPLRPRLPAPRPVLTVGLGLLLLAGVSTAASTVAYLRLPAPTGALAVGRVDTLLSDPSRTEDPTRGGGPRAIRVLAWYPAQAGTGAPAAYVPGLDRIADGLVASGELPAPVVAALGAVGTAARQDAAPEVGERWPVLVLSPGNATNVAFYASLAEELASRGYVVLGVDHPFQVAAVDLGQRGAVFRETSVPGDGGASVAAKIDERVADLAFLLDRLADDAAGLPGLAGRLDLERLGVLGHSNGGLAAAGLCADARVRACANLDGQQLGGPFSALPDPAAPTKPFLFLTKETRLHAAIRERFEAGGADTYRVVVPVAAHDAFTDGPRLRPRVLPVDGTADHVLAIERAFVAAFFDRHLRDAGGVPFAGLAAPEDVYVEVYPLGDQPALPAG